MKDIHEYFKLTLKLIIDIEKTKPTKNKIYEYPNDGIEIDYDSRSRDYYVNFCCDNINISIVRQTSKIFEVTISEFYNDCWIYYPEIELKEYKFFRYYDPTNYQYTYIDNYDSFNIITELTEEELFYLKLKYPKEMGIIEYCNMIISDKKGE